MAKTKKNTTTKQGKKSLDAVYAKMFVMLIASLLLELLIANFTALTLPFSGVDKKKLDLETPRVSVTEEEPLELYTVDAEMKNLCITVDSPGTSYMNLTVSFTDDNFRYSDAFEYNRIREFVKIAPDTRICIPLSSYGKVGTLRIESEDPIVVTAVELNSAPDYSFSKLRFLFIFAVLMCVFFGLWELPAGEKSERSTRICAAAMCLLVAAFLGVLNSICGAELLTDIPEDVTGEDQYVQLFDAFHKGQYELDINVDTEQFDKMDCPYDRSERNALHVRGGFWDRAYYDGKFYSYFGVAPIFTVYYPVWLLTRHMPTSLLVSGMLCMYCVIFISLLYGLIVRRFCKGAPLVLVLFGQVALLFGSVIFAAAAEVKFYYIAVLSGVAWTAAFLYFIFSAYYAEKFRRRIVLLMISGICAVLIVASRPTLVLYGLIALIPAIDIFRSKKETAKQKAAYLCAVGAPLLIGAILIMAYNKARFDDPFEFGFNYQLTVSRAQANTIKLAMLPAALYHYFLQQPGVTSSFPYITINSNSFDTYTRFNYNGRTMGILSYPISWGAFFLPFTLRIKDRFKTLVVASFAAVPLLMAFIDMCKAGSHYRYTTDIAFAFLIAGLIGIFELADILKNKNLVGYRIFYVITAIAMTATVFFGAMLMYSNESREILYSYPGAVAFWLEF